MLRPSRPMMRPFMSSAWSWTTDTVVSAAWPAASRCMTTERMLRTRRSASRLVSSSIARTRRAESWRTWSSSSLSRSALACDADMPDARSSCADVLLARSRRSGRSRSASRALARRRARPCASRASSSRAWSRSSSAAGRRRGARLVVGARRGAPAVAPSPGRRGARRRALACASTPAAITRPAASPRATTTAAITISIAFPLPGAAARWAAARALSLSLETRQADPCPGTSGGDEQEGGRAAAPSDGGCDALLGRFCRARPPGCGA